MITENISEKVYGSSGNPDVEGLIPPEARFVLDVGCGAGTLASTLQKRGFIVDGITISKEELQQAQHHLRNGFLQNLEEGLPSIPNANYDVVVCSHVLEHICYPGKLLRDIHEALNDGGHLIVALPNIMHYKARWQLIRGNFEYQSQGLWDYTHFRWYTFESAKRLLEANGFTIEFAGVTGELPFNSVFSQFVSHSLRRKMFNHLSRISKGFFGYQLLFKASKVSQGYSKPTIK